MTKNPPMPKQQVVLYAYLCVDEHPDYDEAVEVPVEVVCWVYPGVAGDYYNPPEYPFAAIVSYRTTDKSPWTTELDALFNQWWDRYGQEQALELASEDNREYERDDQDD